MNKRDAEKIARSGKITWGQVQSLLTRVYEADAADECQSIVNPSFSKAAIFNVMCGYADAYPAETMVDVGRYSTWVGASHCLREFGEFWDGWRPEKPKRRKQQNVKHQPAKSPSWTL